MMTALLLSVLFAQTQTADQFFPDPLVRIPSWAKPGRCGINCLYLLSQLLRSSGSQPNTVRYEDVLAALPTHEPGIGNSLAELADAAGQLGLSAECREIPRRKLARVPTPCIAHLDQFDSGGAGHFVVIYRYVNEDTALYIDGTTGQLSELSLSSPKPGKTLSGFFLVPSHGRGEESPTTSTAVVIGVLGLVLGMLCGIFLVWRQSRTNHRV